MSISSQKLKKNRLARIRLWCFLVLHGLILLHLFLWYGLGWRGFGAIDFQELFRHGFEHNTWTAGAVFFAVFLVLGLIWGRFFCGWLCHIGQTYDLLFPFLAARGRTFRPRFGALIAGAVLVWYFLWESVQNRLQHPDLPASWSASATAPWALLPGFWVSVLTLGLLLLVLPLLLGPRPFCRFLCPWGVLLGMFNRFALLKIRKTGDCHVCGACNLSCPMDIDVSRAINQAGQVNHLGCIGCLQCVAVCPDQVLSFARPPKQPAPALDAGRVSLLHAAIARFKRGRAQLGQELVFWALTLTCGWTYAEFYGLGVFPAFALALLLAALSLSLWQGRRGYSLLRRGFYGVLILALWGIVLKDGYAHVRYKQGNRAFAQKHFRQAQIHFESADRWMWVAPNALLYRLYTIYKTSGQEAERQALYLRYEERRARQGKQR